VGFFLEKDKLFFYRPCYSSLPFKRVGEQTDEN